MIFRDGAKRSHRCFSDKKNASYMTRQYIFIEFLIISIPDNEYLISKEGVFSLRVDS